MSYGTEVEEEGGISRGPRAGEAGAAQLWWQGGHVARSPPWALVSKAPRAIHQVSTGKQLLPRIQSTAPVDEKPLEGRDPVPPMWRPCWARAGYLWLWGGDGAWGLGCGLGQERGCAAEAMG